MTTDLVFEFTSTAPEMEKAASAALKRLQESALKTVDVLGGAGKSSAKDLRKMVAEMEVAAGGSVEALSNMASRMEQRANSFRKDATNLRRAAQDHAKLLRDAAKQLQEASEKLGSVDLPRKGASAASVKAFTSQFTSAASQFEDAVDRVGVATAAYIKVDQDFENRLKKKKPKVDLGQDGMKEALKEVDKNADQLNFRISQLAKWQAEYDALYRKAYENLGEGVSYKSIKADDLLPLSTITEYQVRGVKLGSIDREFLSAVNRRNADTLTVLAQGIAAQGALDKEQLAKQKYNNREARQEEAKKLRSIRQENADTLTLISQGVAAQGALDKEQLAKQKYNNAERRKEEAKKLRDIRQENADTLTLISQGIAAQSALDKERLEQAKRSVAAATNTPAGDFQRYNASSGQAGRLVTVNGLANGPTAGEIATSTRQARDRADELARSLRGVTLEANTLHSASRGLASGFNMLWLTWGEMLPLLAGAAISFGTAFSVKMGAQVDHTLQTIRVLSGETREAIAGLNDQLLQLASTGPVGPLEVAEAMKTLSLAGMSAGDVSVAIRDVMNFAVAGTTDLKQAADVMTSVATAFNVTATGFNYVGDVIAKTAAVSKASVESVGEAFKTASVIHKQFGVSLEDAGVGIAALANLGIQGTAAGTALRNMYTDLSGRTPKVTKALQDLKIELRDQKGNFKDLVTLTMEFDKGLSRLDGTAQKNALLTILSERGGKPMIELRQLVIEEEKVAREFAKRSGQVVVEGFEEGVKNRLQRMRDSIGDNAGFQIMARIELSETPLKQMETAVSALQSSLVSAFSSVKSEASGVALALQDLFRSDSFKSNIESLLQLTLNLAGGLVSLAKFANENAGVLATLTAAYIGLRLAVGNSLELMTFYTKAQTLATTRSWAATAAVTAERVAQGPLAVQKAIATSATQADTLATWANTGAKYAAITASKLFAATLPYVGVVLAVATGAWMLYESVVGSSTKKMEDAAESSAHGKMIAKLNEETARLNENTDAMLANMTVEQLRLSRGQGVDGSKLGKHKELISAEENLAKATARRVRAQETADGTDDRVAVTMLLEGQAKDKLAAEQENARLIKKSVQDATARTVNAANLNAEVTKKMQEARQAAAKTGTDKFLAEQQRQLAGTAAQNKLDNDLRYNHLDEIAKANKAELDGLRSRLNSEAEALKDFRDANMVQEGEYQSRITSITLEGEKAQKAAAISGWLSYAAEIDRLLTGLSAMPKSQISDNDKANRVQELNAKLLNAAEEFNNRMASIDEEAAKRERRLATDQYKELDKLRKANETAIANSRDRVQAIRDEQAMADKTLGLGGVDLEATQARLKIELEAKKELRKFDLESLDKIQARDRLRADAELAADDETWEAKHRRADDFDAQLRILAKGRADFEVQTQTEVAETVAAVYRKEFKRRTDELATTLSGALVDTLMNAGKEGGRNLRRTLEQELLAKPFRMVVQALIQPFAQQAAAGINNFLGVPGGAGAAGNLIGAGASLASLGTANAVGAVGGDALGSLIASNATNWGVSSAGVGGLAGAASTIASAVPYVAAFGAVASLIKSLDDSGTMHTGGLGSYSAARGSSTGDAVKAQGLKFGVDSKDYSAATAQASVAIATSVANMLDQTAETFGNKAGYYAATAFADDTSSDGAWGALRVKLGDTLVTDWETGRNIGREFSDGEAGAKEYAAAIGKDMRDYLITQTPDWADQALNALGDTPTLEDLTKTVGQINMAATTMKQAGVEANGLSGWMKQAGVEANGLSGWMKRIAGDAPLTGDALQAIAEYPGKLLELAGTSRDALVQTFTEGLLNGSGAVAAGQSVADALVASIEQTLVGGAAGAVFDVINRGIVTPVIDAMLTGQSVTELMSQASIDAVIRHATEAAEVFTRVLNDPAFKGALERMRTQLGSALGASLSGAGAYIPRYQPTVAVSVNSSADTANDIANETLALQDRLNAVTLTRVQLLERERSAVHPLNATLFDQVVLTEEQKSIQDELNSLTLTRSQLLDLERANILPANRALFDELQLKREAKPLQEELNSLTESRTQAIQRERSATLDGNKALFDSVNAVKQLTSAVATLDSVGSKFMSGPEWGNYRLARVKDKTNAALGTQFTLEDLQELTVDNLKQLVRAYTLSGAPLEKIDQVLQLGAELIDIKDEIASEYTDLMARLGVATKSRLQLLEDERSKVQAGNRALFDQVQIAEEAKTLQERLNASTLSKIQLLALEREAILPANRAMFDLVAAFETLSESKTTLVSNLNEIASEMQSLADTFDGLFESLTKYKGELLSGEVAQLSPQEAYKASKKALTDSMTAVAAGDEKALGSFQELASKFLEDSKSYLASSTGYFSDLELVKGFTDTAVAAAKRQSDSAIAKKTDAEKQLEALGELNNSVLSLADAMRGYAASVATTISIDLTNKLGQIDTDGSGTVQLKELVAKFGTISSEATLAKVFSTLDLDGDKQISLAEAIKGSAASTATAAGSTAAATASTATSVGSTATSTAAVATMTTDVKDNTKATANKLKANFWDLDQFGQAAALQWHIDMLYHTVRTTALLEGIYAKASVTTATVATTTAPTTVASGKTATVATTTAPTTVAYDSALADAASSHLAAGGSPVAIYDAIKAGGYTLAEADVLLGAAPGSLAREAAAMGLPVFARGGFHSGGMRLVGENGPELEVTGASRIYSAQQTRDLLADYSGQSDNSELVAELRALRAEVAELKQHAAANVRVAQAVGKAQIETLEVIADASADSAKSQRLMELAR